MITELRIYTANRGQLDAFVKAFHEQLMPIQAKYGIKVTGTWIDRSQNELVWMRTFDDEADRAAKTEAFRNAPEVAALGGQTISMIAKTQVRVLEDAQT
jgi:hypothetical protein